MTSGENRARTAASAAVTLAALALAAGCASAGAGSATTTSGAKASTSPGPDSALIDGTVSSATLARLARLADAAASAEGGVARSAEAVRSTRRAANLAMGGDVVATDPGEAVWAIEVVGKAPFVCDSCSVAPGAKAPQGTVITMVLDASSFTATDSGLSDQVPNLAALGTPVSLPV
ncbi:hypothetical protein [Catenulispora pinisilvae]|nr:hypothetical protein [Catenulispora pinisilvae]